MAHRERRHSTALADQKRIVSLSMGHSRAMVLKQDLDLGVTRSRLFHDALADELRREVDKQNTIRAVQKEKKDKNQAIMANLKSGSRSTTNALLELTKQIHALRKMTNAAAAAEQISPDNGVPVRSSRQHAFRKKSWADLKITTASTEKTWAESWAKNNPRSVPKLFSPIQAAATRNVFSSKVTPLRLDKIQQYTSTVSKTGPPTFIPPTPKIVRRLTDTQNYTGLQRRNANKSKPTNATLNRSRSLSSCTLSHQDLREERTARLAFAKSLRGDDFYNLGER